MKKFYSRLTTLVKIRQNQEDDAKKKLISIFRQLQEMLNQQQHIDKEISYLSNPQKNQKIFTIEHASKTAFYVEHLQNKKKILDKFIDEKKIQAAEARENVIETTKQRKLIENIENKEKDTWRKNGEKQEEKFFDDLSSSRFIKKKFQLKRQLKSQNEKDTQNY